LRPATAARRLGLALAVIAGATSASAAAADRAIRTARPGRTAVVLDADVYERARPDLGDLRVIDDQGKEVPYLLDWMSPAPPAEPRRPLLEAQPDRHGPLHGQLDFERPVLKREIALSLAGDDFRWRVVVEGRGEHDRQWRAVAVGYVAALPGPPPERYDRLPLPDNNDRYLRVTVDADDAAGLVVQDATAPAETRGRRKGNALAAGVARTEAAEGRESQLVLSLGGQYQPFIALALEVDTKTFFRGAVLEAQGPAGSWTPLTEAAVYRLERDGATEERLVLEASGRAGTLRIRIRNGAEPPLVVRHVSATVPLERLAFDAAAGRSYRLRYGEAALAAPRYDLARTIGDAGIWAAGAVDARLEDAPSGDPATTLASWPRSRALAGVVGALLAAILLALGWQVRRAT
jgi:hypothetical protein